MKGHAVHFRCRAPDVRGLRIDLIAVLRGCPDFNALCKRRTTVKLKTKDVIEVIGLEDLVNSKKTQRDKDWFMLKRFVTNNIKITAHPAWEKIRWWFSECRDAGILNELCHKYKKVIDKKPVFILIEGIGQPVPREVPLNVLKQFYKYSGK